MIMLQRTSQPNQNPLEHARTATHSELRKGLRARVRARGFARAIENAFGATEKRLHDLMNNFPRD